MMRRQFILMGLALSAAPVCLWAQARIDWSALSRTDATKGLREVLETGALAAVQRLGRADGFLADSRWRVPLPSLLNEAQGLLRTLGQGQRLDELITAMNRAAESAVPLAKPLLRDAVKRLTVQDAKAILKGGDTAVTDYFARQTRPALTERFLPIVTRVTSQIGLAQRYNGLVDQVASLGVLRSQPERVEQHVTASALNGLYGVIGEQERQLRQNPLEAGSAILRRVLGALGQ